jgi:hypothetical protein
MFFLGIFYFFLDFRKHPAGALFVRENFTEQCFRPRGETQCLNKGGGNRSLFKHHAVYACGIPTAAGVCRNNFFYERFFPGRTPLEKHYQRKGNYAV